MAINATGSYTTNDGVTITNTVWRLASIQYDFTNDIGVFSYMGYRGKLFIASGFGGIDGAILQTTTQRQISACGMNYSFETTNNSVVSYIENSFTQNTLTDFFYTRGGQVVADVYCSTVYLEDDTSLMYMDFTDTTGTGSNLTDISFRLNGLSSPTYSPFNISGGGTGPYYFNVQSSAATGVPITFTISTTIDTLVSNFNTIDITSSGAAIRFQSPTSPPVLVNRLGSYFNFNNAHNSGHIINLF